MAKIISLGCDLADTYRRYAAVHSDLFGALSLHFVKNSLTGKGCSTCVENHKTLLNLLDQISELEMQITGCNRNDLSFHRAEELQEIMLKYVAALAEAVRRLAGIVQNLTDDEQTYRRIDASGHSHFNRDKVEYDQSRSELQNLGARLNRLFPRR